MPAAHRAKQAGAHPFRDTKVFSKMLGLRSARANFHFNVMFPCQISSPIEHLIIERV